jgi:ubiquinone/menaquinone biosynthesis C-methylase UbiE
MVEIRSAVPLPPEKFNASIGGGDYRAIGQHFFEIFVNHCGLLPAHDVLDIGSGCGRMAVPLTTYLDSRSQYHGIDIVGPMVEWCTEHITSRYPNFTFQHAQLTNTLYSQAGERAAEYRLPFPDARFDFVFLTSVFTHLNPADADNYLREIKRVLKPGGRVLMTFYLMNETYRLNRKKKRVLVTFDHGAHPYWVNDPKVPEAVAAYDEAYILARIRESGLTIDAVHHGGWAGQGGLSFQDIIIGSKKP